MTVQGTLPMDWTPITMRLRGMGLLKTPAAAAQVPSPSQSSGGDVETGLPVELHSKRVGHVEKRDAALDRAVVVVRNGSESSGQSSASSPRVAASGDAPANSSLCARLVAQCCETRPVFDQPQPPTAAERAAELSTLEKYADDNIESRPVNSSQ